MTLRYCVTLRPVFSSSSTKSVVATCVSPLAHMRDVHRFAGATVDSALSLPPRGVPGQYTNRLGSCGALIVLELDVRRRTPILMIVKAPFRSQFV